MDNSHSEQESPDLILADLKKVHKTTTEIASEVSPKTNEETPSERRKLLRKIWNKLIPVEKQHKKETSEAISEGEIDILTQVYNSRGFTRRWTEEISRLRRAKKDAETEPKTDDLDQKSVILYLDANMLKQVNDEKGHDAGNQYLQNLALALKESVRPTDIIGRIGGDEFAVILQRTTLPSTRDLIEQRIKPQLGAKGVSVSIGAESINMDNPEESKNHADEAMYEAKRMSRVAFGTIEYREYGENIR